MLRISDYHTLIFDCDGVILNSNQLKISAMRNAVLAYVESSEVVEECVEYFASNFGLSRYHHVKHFVEVLLALDESESSSLYDAILSAYSDQCYKLYMKAELTPGVVNLLQTVTARCYVASGSDQSELRRVFRERKLSSYFVEIYGSPDLKADVVARICSMEKGQLLMVGDAVSDFMAAEKNNIDFLFYAPFSNVNAKMNELCRVHNFPICNDFNDLV